MSADTWRGTAAGYSGPPEMKRGELICVIIAGLALLLSPLSALAGCSNPTDSENKLMYNSDYHTYQFCNGTNWVIAGQILSAAASGPSGPQTIGDLNVEGSTDSGNANWLISQPATLGHAAAIQSLSIYVTTAAGNLRLGIYDATGPSGGPGAKEAETNAFATTTGWNTANVITPVTLPAGNYWLAFLTNNDSMQNAANWGSSQSITYYPFTYGIMPATYSTTPTYSTGSYSLYATFASGCANPTGNERDIIYNKDYHTLQYCNGVYWVPLGPGSGGGSGNCSSPAGTPGQFIYNSDYHTFQFCNGTNWVKFGGGSSVPLPGPSDGYFVMSKSTWNGNLAGLAGADAKCLTDLTTNTGWHGYGDANARGILTSGHVHAFGVCVSTGGHTNNLSPNTQYFFADTNNSWSGGASFTTNSSGYGPDDSADWSTSSYFGSDYVYWTNIGTGTSTLWDGSQCTNTSGAACADFSYTGTGYNGAFGESKSGYTGSNRWIAPDIYGLHCDTTRHLICFVNP